MAINAASFIKAEKNFDNKSCGYAPLFRRKFQIPEVIQTAKLYVCGLGYGYYYMNGKSVTEDLFTAPVSNYNKTIWYNTYDVTELLNEGENLFAAECGNGWYNEAVESCFCHNKMPGRDMPKLRVALEINGELALVSDGSFKCKNQAAVVYNQLRVGEVFDARLYEEGWNTLEYDDSAWSCAYVDENPPRGVMRECTCEPLREMEEIAPIEIINLGDNKYIFDFGKNMSGYARIKIKQAPGDVIYLRYFEKLNPDNTFHDDGYDKHFNGTEVQTYRFICGDDEFSRTPRFTYYGFRYIYAEGIKEPKEDTLTAIFVHHTFDARTSFECSHEGLNKLFAAGMQSTISNILYMPTDCPTREKCGWFNDLQSSTEQFLIDFKSEKLLSKWWQDICDTMLDNGMLPGAMPIDPFLYEWGNGPVSEGILFEIPYRIYLHTGNDSLLKKGIPFFKRNISLLTSKFSVFGEINYGLWDWGTPYSDDYVGCKFLNEVLLVKFLRILKLAQELNNENTEETDADLEFFTNHVLNRYLDEQGECTENSQAAVAMLIYFGLYHQLEPLKQQLKRLIEEKNMHHNCGMVGLRYLYPALNQCGLQEYAYQILTAKDFPSYLAWIEDGATTLYEAWDIDLEVSRNHHMYSSFMPWLVKTVGGIRRYHDSVGYEQVEINPYFFQALEYARVSSDTVHGEISVFWERKGKHINLEFNVPKSMTVHYNGKEYREGSYTFEL